MKNKYLIQLSIPFIAGVFDMYIPINERIDIVIQLILKGVKEIIDEDILNQNLQCVLIDASTGQTFDNNSVVRSSGIKNGSKLVLTIV